MDIKENVLWVHPKHNMVVKASPGVIVSTAIDEAIKLAKVLDSEFTLSFNDFNLRVSPSSDPSDLIQNWQRQLSCRNEIRES